MCKNKILNTSTFKKKIEQNQNLIQKGYKNLFI